MVLQDIITGDHGKDRVKNGPKASKSKLITLVLIHQESTLTHKEFSGFLLIYSLKISLA